MNGLITAGYATFDPFIIPPLKLGSPDEVDAVGAYEKFIAAFFITIFPSGTEPELQLYMQEKSTTEKFKGVLFFWALKP